MIKRIEQFESQQALSVATNDPVVLCASDDHYAMPLTVTLQSAAQHLSGDAKLQVLLMDGGISDSKWAMIKESLVDEPIDIHVIRPEAKHFSDLNTSHHITHTAYFRLKAAELLPESVERVIYLDSDVLVCDDLTKLWELPLGDDLCLAAQDIACPFVDARSAGTNQRRSTPYMASLAPIPNWRELNLPGEAAYFNSGVMVLNLKQWRKENVGEQLLRCLRDNEQHVWCWDQYALNVVCAGRWRQLPLRWNQGAHVFEYPDESFSPVKRDEFLQMKDNPAIIHFTTEWKPWGYRQFNPNRARFYAQLDQTAWKGWRPEKPAFRFIDKWNQFAVLFCKRWIIAYRKLMGGVR